MPRYAACNVSSHLRACLRKLRWQLRLFRRLTRGKNILLLCCGDVERNPGPNPAARNKNNKESPLTTIHINARSLLRHFEDVACLVSTEHPHILAVSETWLDSSVTDEQIHLPGYNIFRSDRNRNGGGVAVYCLDCLPCSFLSNGTSPSGAEFLWISVKTSCFHPSLAVACFYRPPGTPSQSVHDVCDNIEAMMLNRKYLIACGDFNIDMSDSSSSLSRTFQQFISSHSLTQSISTPTRYNHTTASASILDLFLTTPDISIHKARVLNTSFSDHLPILLQLNASISHPSSPTLVTLRSFKNFDSSYFEEDLSYVPWQIIDLFDDPDDKVEVFTHLFVDILDKHAPFKTVRVKKNPTPWISKKIKKEMDRRDRLFRFYRRNPSTPSLEIFKAQRNRIVWLQRKAKIEYFHRLLNKSPHPSTIWNTLKLATSSSSSSTSSTSTDRWSSFNSDSTTIANLLNSHFASVSSNTTPPTPDQTPTLSLRTPTPLLSFCPTTPQWCEQTLSGLKPKCASGLDLLPSSSLIAARSVISYPLSSIINSSIASSQFPTPWKSAVIKPLHKGGDHATPSNYRPISLLPIPSKVLEKHLHHQLSCHLYNNNLLFPLQSGFRPTHSTQTLLLYCLDNWYKALDRKQYIGVVFLDISKAFDTVNHDLLLSKLNKLGLSPATVSWLNLTSPIVVMLLRLPTLALPKVFLQVVSLKVLSWVPLFFRSLSMIFHLFFLLTPLFSSPMTWPYSLSVIVSLLFNLLFKPA